MQFKKLYTLAVTLIIAALPAIADNWIMVLDTENGWTVDNETVSVVYSFDRNATNVGARMQPTACAPKIFAKIKNNTDEFIYIDLSKTYITRNGEAELYQNIVAMSTNDSKDKEEKNTSMAQNVMPVPPHASKTFAFPLFATADNCYDGHVVMTKGYRTNYYLYKTQDQPYLDEIFEYNMDNSPIHAFISFAYSTTEKGERQVNINKDFYVSFAAAVNNTLQKNFDTVLPDYDNLCWFTMQASQYFQKKKVEKAKKDKKKDKKEKKDKKDKKEKKNKKEKKEKTGGGILGNMKR